MALQDLLVHLDGSPRAAARLDHAAALAARHDAHLIGLYAVETALPLALTGYYPVAEFGQLVERFRQDAAARALAARGAFEEKLRRDGLNGEWREVDLFPADPVALHARYADLTVVGQPEPGSAEEESDIAILEAALFQSGRPILVVPYAGKFQVTPERVLVAWNAGREAARAVHDALPLLRAASHVDVVAVNPRQGIGGHGEVPGADIALHLARHDVKVTARQILAEDLREADVLLNEVADSGAGLVVMGAYGHSRLRQFILGGVTRGILSRMTVPVLLAH
ncbi:universal stress protein [Roseomonas sp. F4]